MRGRPFTARDRTGEVYGLLTVEAFSHIGVAPGSKRKTGQAWWRCRCVCGGSGVYLGTKLTCGDRRSCGCRTGSKSPLWRDDEVDSLTRLWPAGSPAELTAALPRQTWKAIQLKAAKLSIRRHRPWDLPPSTTVLPGELWRVVPGMSGRCWVSTFGRVAGRRSLLAARPRCPARGEHQRAVTIRLGGERRTSRDVAGLVLQAFAPPPTPGAVLTHRDGDEANNRLENLHWLSTVREPKTKAASRPSDDAAESRVRALTQNELWRAAGAALPKGLDPDTRNDVTGDIVIAVLSGELAVSEIPGRAAEYLRAHRRTFDTFRNVSLDAPVPGRDRGSWIDNLADDVVRF